MSWARIDPGLHDHPKFISLWRQPEAIQLWLFSLSWTTLHRTSGVIPPDIPKLLMRCREDKAKKIAGYLVEAGLWEVVPHGYVIHDYLEYNYSKEQVEDERAFARTRQRRARMSRHVSRVTRDNVTRDTLSRPLSTLSTHNPPNPPCDVFTTPEPVETRPPEAVESQAPAEPFDDPEAVAAAQAGIACVKDLLQRAAVAQARGPAPAPTSTRALFRGVVEEL